MKRALLALTLAIFYVACLCQSADAQTLSKDVSAGSTWTSNTNASAAGPVARTAHQPATINSVTHNVTVIETANNMTLTYPSGKVRIIPKSKLLCGHTIVGTVCNRAPTYNDVQ